jgi:hypothetical protein
VQHVTSQAAYVTGTFLTLAYSRCGSYSVHCVHSRRVRSPVERLLKSLRLFVCTHETTNRKLINRLLLNLILQDFMKDSPAISIFNYITLHQSINTVLSSLHVLCTKCIKWRRAYRVCPSACSYVSTRQQLDWSLRNLVWTVCHWRPPCNCFNFLQLVITTWRTRELVLWERHLI